MMRNASLLPSADHAGDKIRSAQKRGKLTIRFRSREYIIISQPALGQLN